ncbi:MAG: adenylate/guanylate cyclase domain-containing protein [Candidatus Xenobia bacterium]
MSGSDDDQALVLDAAAALRRGLGGRRTRSLGERLAAAPHLWATLLGELTRPSPFDTGEAANNTADKARSHRFLETGFELMVHPPGQTPWSVPLLFSELSIGSRGERTNDVELNFPGVANVHARLVLRENHFTVVAEDPTAFPVKVDGEEISEWDLQDEDLVVIGPVWFQVFRNLSKPARISVIAGPDLGRVWKLSRSLMYLGRRGMRYNDIELADPTVSRTHARIEYVSGQVNSLDVQSRDGTIDGVVPHSLTGQPCQFQIVPETGVSHVVVNGQRSDTPCILADGDQIALGETFLIFNTEAGLRQRSLKPRDVTILFSDLRGYSSIAERYPLVPMVEQLKEYLGAMGEVIHAAGGTLLSYQGDAVMAVFGAPQKRPDDAVRAVQCALAMRRALGQLNERWQHHGQPTFNAGIGINTGRVMVGDIGTAEHSEYAAVGDDTNVAARIEELTRSTRADILISEKTWQQVNSAFQCEDLGPLSVRGRENGVRVFRVVAAREVAPA